MEVTFRANARIGGFHPGVVYTTEATPLIRALLSRGTHLTLIDPLELESEDDSSESNSPSKVSGQTAESDYGDGAKKKSGKSSSGSSESGSEVGRNKEFYRRDSGSGGGGETGGQSSSDDDDSKGETRNSN